MLSSIQPRQAASSVCFCSAVASLSHPYTGFNDLMFKFLSLISVTVEHVFSSVGSHLRVAIDTGGTFTDCVYLADGQLRVLKLFSTPTDPSQAVLDGLERIGADKAIDVRHGTTVGTNTMLERKGARVAFVTTAGFEDTIAIGRQTRASSTTGLRPCRCAWCPASFASVSPSGSAQKGKSSALPPKRSSDPSSNQIRASGAEAVAISLLFSFANPETERRVEAALRCLGIPDLRLAPHPARVSRV